MHFCNGDHSSTGLEERANHQQVPGYSHWKLPPLHRSLGIPPISHKFGYRDQPGCKYPPRFPHFPADEDSQGNPPSNAAEPCQQKLPEIANCYSTSKHNRQSPTQYNFYRPSFRHYYHQAFGIRPIKSDTTRLSYASNIDFSELGESLSQRGTNELFKSDKHCHHHIHQLDHQENIKTHKSFKKLSLKNKSEKKRNIRLSTLLIEGPTITSYTRQSYSTNETTFGSEDVLPSYESVKLNASNAPHSLMNSIVIRFPTPPSPENDNVKNQSINNTENVRINQLRTTPNPQTVDIVGRKYDLQESNDTMSGLSLPFIPMTQPAIKNFPSKVRKANTHQQHKGALEADNKKVQSAVSLPPIVMPRTNMFLGRSSNRPRKRKPSFADQERFKITNPYPDLSIVGSQIQSLQDLSEMMGDVIQSTLNTVNSLIESSGERLRRLRRNSRKRKYRKWLEENGLPILEEDFETDEDFSYDDEDLSTDYDENHEGLSHSKRNRTRRNKYKHKSNRSRASGLSSSSSLYGEDDMNSFDDTVSGDGGRKRRKKGSRTSNAMADFKHLSQKERLAMRLKQKGVNLIDEEEAMKILMQAKSDINQLKQPKGKKDSKALKTDGDRSDRVRRRKAKTKKGKRKKRRNKANGTSAVGKSGSSSEYDDNDLLEGEENDKDNRLSRKRRKHRRKHKRAKHGTGNGQGGSSELSETDTNSSEDYDSEDYDSEDYDSEEYDSEDYDSEEYDSEEYDSEDYDSGDYSEDYSGSSSNVNNSKGHSKRRRGRARGKHRNKVHGGKRSRRHKLSAAQIGANASSNGKRSSKPSAHFAHFKRQTGSGNMIDEISAMMKLVNGVDDPLVISRPGSTISKPPTSEGKRSKSGKSVQHVMPGPDLHQQRIIAMRNASAMKKKIEQEKMIEAKCTEEEKERERLLRQQELEAAVFGDCDIQEKLIRQRKQMEQEAKTRYEQEKTHNEIKELERLDKIYLRKEKDKETIMKKLEKLQNEVETRQVLHNYQQAIVDQYYREVEIWDNVDYNYIECYLGKEYRDRISEMDKEKRLAEAIQMEQQLLETFELKRQELLLKLKHAHDKFTEKITREQESQGMDCASKVSRAFVYSYFECLDDKDNVFLLKSFCEGNE